MYILSVLLFIANMLFIFYISMVLMDINYIDKTIERMNAIIGQSERMFNRIGQNEESIEMLMQFKESMQLVEVLLPSFIVIASIVWSELYSSGANRLLIVLVQKNTHSSFKASATSKEPFVVLFIYYDCFAIYWPIRWHCLYSRL